MRVPAAADVVLLLVSVLESSKASDNDANPKKVEQHMVLCSVLGPVDNSLNEHEQNVGQYAEVANLCDNIGMECSAVCPGCQFV